MSEIAIKTPLQYLDQAMGKLRDLGLVQDKQEEAPIVGLLEKIADIEPEKIAIITRTLQQMSIFNEVVRDQVAEMSIGTRYEAITKAFDSIREDAKTMVDQIVDGKLDIFERETYYWLMITGVVLASRFEAINER